MFFWRKKKSELSGTGKLDETKKERMSDSGPKGQVAIEGRVVIRRSERITNKSCKLLSALYFITVVQH